MTDHCILLLSYMRWTEVRFLTNKSEALIEFRNFKAFVEKNHGVSIKEIQSYNGPEFVNAKSDGYCRKASNTDTPQLIHRSRTGWRNE